MVTQRAKRCNDYNERSDATITTSEAMPEGGLLQSKYWTAVLRAEGKDVWQVEDINEETYCTNYKLPLVGRYAYCPRAYGLKEKDFKQIIKQAKDKNLGWVRFDLLTARQDLTVKAPHNMQPKQNFIIDISLPEEKLLSGMKSKTRYNIRLAKKKGVEIFVTREQKYIDKFIDLVEQTAKRKGISFHEREHYLQMFQNIPEDVLKLNVAEYEGEVIAANIVSFYGGVATYLHGATSDQHRNVMAPFLLQWQAILDAKERGIKYYDFGGIFPESSKGGQQGITRFKLGFSPKTKPFQTAGSHDIILNKPKYWLYRFLQRLKR